MPEPNFPMIERKDPPPPGLLPKNAQAKVLGGVAAVMVVVIAFSGRKESKPKQPTPLPTAVASDPNQARIEDYKNRIEEESRKLQAEQAQLMRTQKAIGVTPNGPAATQTSPYATQGSPVNTRWDAPSPVREKSAIEMDREKREYQSLFASNIAFTLRPEAKASTPATSDPANALLALANALASKTEERPSAASAASKSTDAETVPGQRADGRSSASTRAREKHAERATSAGPEYALFEGTVIETVLTNRLDGSFSGPVNCMVTINIYSQNGQHLLIPQGTRVLGEVKRVEAFGQERLAVTFHRLIMPDGHSVALDQFQGLNQIGETGLRDRVNHHYLQVFGVSIAIGAIAGLGHANTQYGATANAADAYQQGVASSLSQSSLRILDRYLNVLPTFTIREGHRVKVYLSDDLLLPAYDAHPLRIDLQGGLP